MSLLPYATLYLLATTLLPFRHKFSEQYIFIFKFFIAFFKFRNDNTKKMSLKAVLKHSCKFLIFFIRLSIISFLSKSGTTVEGITSIASKSQPYIIPPSISNSCPVGIIVLSPSRQPYVHSLLSHLLALKIKPFVFLIIIFLSSFQTDFVPNGKNQVCLRYIIIFKCSL